MASELRTLVASLYTHVLTHVDIGDDDWDIC